LLVCAEYPFLRLRAVIRLVGNITNGVNKQRSVMPEGVALGRRAGGDGFHRSLRKAAAGDGCAAAGFAAHRPGRYAAKTDPSPHRIPRRIPVIPAPRPAPAGSSPDSLCFMLRS
jgi:hypothetical protein